MRYNTCPWGGSMHLPPDIIFCDLTLREGEQTPGASYTQEERIELVTLLDRFGIHQIQISVPGLNPRALASCREICAVKTKAKKEIMTGGMAPNWKELIDAANDCNPDIIHSGFEVSHFNAREWNESVREGMKARVREVAAYILSKGKICNISFTDATRADFGFLMAMVETAAAAGARRVRIADSFGVGTPEGMSMAVANAVKRAEPHGCIVGVHCHNDFGLALANTFACIRAGAKLIDLCANGLGDRAGNADLVEAAVALEALYGAPTGLDTAMCMEIARFTEKISGIVIPPNKPLVGSNVFSEEMEAHFVEQFERPVEGRSLVPEDIGARLGVLYGSLTTERIVKMTGEYAKKPIPEQHVPAIVDKIHAQAQKQKGVPINEETFWEIADGVMGKQP